MSSGFISESELAERRKVRQEEWEKVRQPNQPLEAPEEEYDHRSLFERLEEQKKKKEFEYEEAHRLKNMIKGLDDDEIDFLELVDRSKMEEERKKCAEEELEMADFRNKVASLQEQSLEQRIQQEVRRPPLKNNNIKTGRSSQTKLLAGVIKKRQLPVNNTVKEGTGKRSRTEIEEEKVVEEKECKQKSDTDKQKPEVLTNTSVTNTTVTVTQQNVGSQNKLDVGEKTGGLTCIGILPGLGTYSVSSDESDCSTDLDEDAGPARFDLLGRRIKRKSKTNSNK
uniref:Putative nefa-interacting nuclear protein nip30 n=1 Tax=Panstrongylus lignarius TaxID=156445 RepID=A0A224XUY6_9HEMI